MIPMGSEETTLEVLLSLQCGQDSHNTMCLLHDRPTWQCSDVELVVVVLEFLIVVKVDEIRDLELEIKLVVVGMGDIVDQELEIDSEIVGVDDIANGGLEIELTTMRWVTLWMES